MVISVTMERAVVASRRRNDEKAILFSTSLGRCDFDLVEKALLARALFLRGRLHLGKSRLVHALASGLPDRLYHMNTLPRHSK
jgi:hypothetical protein